MGWGVSSLKALPSSHSKPKGKQHHLVKFKCREKEKPVGTTMM
jgi:hypothetical protein